MPGLNLLPKTQKYPNNVLNQVLGNASSKWIFMYSPHHLPKPASTPTSSTY